ncbi:MAG: aspartate dehydrogenase, partial [Betaproteobacteria bacterium]
MREMAGQDFTLIGYGAIGRALHQRLDPQGPIRLTQVVVSAARVQALQAELGSHVQVSDRVP